MNKNNIYAIVLLGILIVAMVLFVQYNNFKVTQMIVLVVCAYILGRLHTHQIKIGEKIGREEQAEEGTGETLSSPELN